MGSPRANLFFYDGWESVGMLAALSRQNRLKLLRLATGLLATLVLALGVTGWLGHTLGKSRLLTFLPDMPPIAMLTASSFLCVGTAILLILALDITRIERSRYRHCLETLRTLAVLGTIGIGLFCVGKYLWEAHFDLVTLILLRRSDDLTPTVVTSSRILITGLSLLLFLLWRNRESVITYAVNLPALYLLYASVFTLTGHYLQLPFLYKYMVSIPASLGFISIGFALLLGTIPYQGTLEPLFSSDGKSRAMAWLAVFLSLTVLGYGLITIVLTLQHIDPELVSNEISMLYFIAELATVMIASIIGVIGLRVVHYRNESLSYALQQAASAKALQQSEQKLRRLVEANIVGVLFWQQDGLITEANDAFLKMLGYEQNELSAGQLSLDGISPAGQPVLDEDSARDLNRYGVSPVVEKRIVAQSGDCVDVLIAFALFQDCEDSGVALVVDISPRKQAERAVLDYQARLMESNRELEQFATVASHDLQEPLRKIQVFGEMLAPMVPQEGQDYLERMRKASERMKTLINDLLILSRVSRKGEPFAPVRLQDVLNEVQEDLQIAIEEAQARILIEPLEPVFADWNQMRQLFQNLISNSVKYRQPNHPPTIRIYNEPEPDSEQSRIVVADDGIGIAPEHHERIFEPFTRLHGMSQYTGTGLGLAICRKIVERHHGKLWVESEPNQGSRFYILLPTLPDTQTGSAEGMTTKTPVNTAHEASLNEALY